DEITAALSRPESKISLFEAALLISRLDNPDLDVEAYREHFNELAVDLKARISKGANAADRLDALRTFLFADNGFHGSRADYYNRANSYIDRVLDDREGIPITLSILFIELGSRIGLDLSGVGLPGHFVVKHRP